MYESHTVQWMTPTTDSVPSQAFAWNPSDKTSNIVLSYSNRRATFNAVGPETADVRSVYSVAAGQKVYVEYVIGNMATNYLFGFATITTAFIGVNSGIATPSTAFGFDTVNGKFLCDDSADAGVAYISPSVPFDRIGIAYNATTGRAWGRVNGGGWNSVKGGAQDPAAGTGGAVVPSMGTLYAHWGATVTGGSFITANFAAASWVDTAPTGFTQLAA